MFDYTPTQDGYIQWLWLDVQVFGRSNLDTHYINIVDFFHRSIK
jgi:hypothetical protein